MATRTPITVAVVTFFVVLGVFVFKGVTLTVPQNETGQLSAFDIRQPGLRYTGRAKGRSTAEVWGDDTMYVALCLAVKDEHFHVMEWVAYHASIGVGRIYFYDDGSQPPMHEVLTDFIQSGLVVYVRLDGPIKEGGRQQMEIYNDCIDRFGAPHKWLGMMDADEFLVIKDGSPSLPAVLQRYEAFGGLAVNWRLFGSSGHATRPPGGILQSFTACTYANYTENRHVKSIVRPGRVEYSQGPHDFKYKEGFFAVNTNLTRVDRALSEPVQSDVLVINHYIVRSREDFDQKIAKGNAMGPDSTKPAGYWDHIERLMVENCTYAVEAGARVQAQLAVTAKHAVAKS